MRKPSGVLPTRWRRPGSTATALVAAGSTLKPQSGRSPLATAGHSCPLAARDVRVAGNEVADDGPARAVVGRREPQRRLFSRLSRSVGVLHGAIAVQAGHWAARLSRRLGLGEGAIIGGRVTQALDRTALSRLAAGRHVVLVTGTNGKTTTAHLLAAALGTQGPVAHNATGANMADGALAALMAHPSAPTAVLEVDELHLGEVAAAVSPAVVVLLNLTRDQLDRSTEVAAVAATIRQALAAHPSTHVIANCDDPLVAAAAAGAPHLRWVAAGANWTEDASLCPRCGQPLVRQSSDWRCGSCGLHRPAPQWQLSGRDVQDPQGRTIPLVVQLPGDYNRRNALTAVAAASTLGVPVELATAAIADVRSVAHRYATVEHGHHRLTLFLAKNPAGWRETLPLARSAPALLLVINAQEADGRDTSWLWDVPFEQLPVAPTAAAGQAATDLGLRLSYADLDHITEPDPITALRSLPPGEVTVIANYTAFTQLWHRLGDRRRQPVASRHRASAQRARHVLRPR
jgi:UDP-N-acetylmuramyl tripeptide synthase